MTAAAQCVTCSIEISCMMHSAAGAAGSGAACTAVLIRCYDSDKAQRKTLAVADIMGTASPIKLVDCG